MIKRDDDEDDRITSSLAGLAVILLLAVIALALMKRIGTANDVQDCVMSGRTNCALIDPGRLPR
jgi:hypothetical protein